MTSLSCLVRTLMMLIALSTTVVASAHDVAEQHSKTQQVPSIVSVNSELPPAPSDVTDVKFHDFFKLPVGKRGLELNDKFLALNGMRVRIVGYMAKAETPTPGMFVLSPLPVDLGDEDESLSDDLPASALFVHTGASQFVVPHITGLIKLTGTLSIGSQEEADGHISTARLILDPEISTALQREAEVVHASSTAVKK
jgi:hypothetical protein